MTEEDEEGSQEEKDADKAAAYINVST